jgi:hypothetical protein
MGWRGKGAAQGRGKRFSPFILKTV